MMGDAGSNPADVRQHPAQGIELIMTESCNCGVPWVEHIYNPDPFLPPAAEVFVPVPHQVLDIEASGEWMHDEGMVSS